MDIVHVISKYVILDKFMVSQGGGYKGLCPFHDEKTPSFTVSPRRGIWRCFGCGESGDVDDFLAKIGRDSDQ